jgi:hypothetical protein
MNFKKTLIAAAAFTLAAPVLAQVPARRRKASW